MHTTLQRPRIADSESDDDDDDDGDGNDHESSDDQDDICIRIEKVCMVILCIYRRSCQMMGSIHGYLFI